MKQIKYRMRFRSCLTDWQEKMLIGHIQSMQDGIIEGLRKTQKNMAGNPFFSALSRASPVALQILKERVNYLLIEKDGHPIVWHYYQLEKDADMVYVLTAPDKDELMGSKQMLSMLPGAITKKLEDDKTLKFLHETIKDMKVENGGYKITTESAG